MKGSHSIFIFAGPGNNGGDGLALARMLSLNRYDVEVHYVKFSDKTSADWAKNRLRLKEETDVSLKILDSLEKFPVISPDDIIIDAILGRDFARSVEGFPAEVIQGDKQGEIVQEFQLIFLQDCSVKITAPIT